VVTLVVNVEVERNVLRRSFLKVSTYGQDIDSRCQAYGGGGGG
jgi:hypothetical protein